jgi:hypothetical protein
LTWEPSTSISNEPKLPEIALEYCDPVSQGEYLQGGLATGAEEDAFNSLLPIGLIVS